MFTKILERGGHLFEVVNFGPPFIGRALALGHALLNVYDQIDAPGRGRARETVTSTHHLITENCYLIFRAGKNLAVRLKDVQEIIDKSGVLGLPGESGFRNGVINLRGTIVPVVNLRAFYGFTEMDSAGEKKLILCRGEATVVALEVDSIVTIHKQEQYQTTTSVKKELAKRKDTLDRMIVYQDETGASEHVLVVNVHNLIRNHLAGENL